MAKVEDNAAHVEALQLKLSAGSALAELYNSREQLFGYPPTEYPQLAEMISALGTILI